MHDGGWRWRKDKAPPPLLARNFLSKCFRLRGLLVSRVTMARIVSRLHPETRQRGASQNYSPFPWSTTRFCRLLPRKSNRFTISWNGGGWKREYGFPVSKKIVLSRFTFAKSLFVHATVWLSLSARYWFWRVIFIVSKIFTVFFF